jgi:hypothetical protein
VWVERRDAHTVLKERDHLKDLIIDGSMILKVIFKKWDGEAWT